VYDLCEMLSGSHAHKSPQKQLHPVVRIVTIRPAPFSGDAFPMKTLPLADCHEMTCSAKFPCSAASLLSPFGGSRQPLDRQLSYYSELMRLASKLHSSQPIGTASTWNPKPSNARNATPKRVALHCLALVTGLPKFVAAVVSADTASRLPGRSASTKDRCVGGCSYRVASSLWAGQNSSCAVHHCTLLIAIAVPVQRLFRFNGLREHE